ncbi:TlpA family protein disulfide reductase [bacterium]|nr:TlpA family protein disulfide reductase [bacterium]
MRPVVLLFRCVALSLLVFLCNCEGKGLLQDSSLAPGRKAPELVLSDLRGGETSLSSFLGEKIVVVNFLASWCKPCEEEMPALLRLQAAMDGKLQVVSIGVEDDEQALREFRDRNGVTFPFLHDKSGAAKQRYRLAGYPETFVFDHDGKLMLVADPSRGGQPSLKFVGPRRWDAPEMFAFFRTVISADKTHR